MDYSHKPHFSDSPRGRSQGVEKINPTNEGATRNEIFVKAKGMHKLITKINMQDDVIIILQFD